MRKFMDDDGFIKQMRNIDLPDKQDKDMMKNVLNGIATNSFNADVINNSELLLRRDLKNICTQMPEMRDVIMVIRDAIIECNVATGEVSRSLLFENHESNEAIESQVRELENRFNILNENNENCSNIILHYLLKNYVR